MKIQFESEKEAGQALQEARDKGLGYCPLIRGICLRHCVCYYEGDIHEPDIDSKFWFIHYPTCTNVLIIGEIRADITY